MTPPTPRHRRELLLAILALLALLAVALIFRERVGPDFWPLDSSRVGPNLVADGVTLTLGFLAGATAAPAIKRRVHRVLDRKLAAHHEALHKRADQHDRMLTNVSNELVRLHKRLDDR